ncbi:MAG: histidine kinase [Alphaproteobacteria bacterium]
MAAPAALLLAAGATPAAAKVLVMGDGGWEVSFDGSVNAFAVYTGGDGLNLPATGATAGHTGGLGAPNSASPDSSFRVRTGLLPAVFGINIKAPTTGGLDMGARIGLYPNISSNTKNGEHNTSDLDSREMFFTVDGSFGQVLAGKTLSHFMGKNILTDMTLFGVGGIGTVAQAGGTTLGRIGYGYVYPQFNGRIQYTTPNMNGFKVSVGVYDPSRVSGSGVTATETDSPRFEGEASYAGTFSGADVSAWLNGMWNEATLTGNSTGPSAANVAIATGAGLSTLQIGDSVNSWGIGGGLQVGIPIGMGKLTLMGSGYGGKALGLTFQTDVDALDPVGQERDHWGYIGQATFGFGQGTSVGFSYGESGADETAFERVVRLAGTNSQINVQRLYDAMVWHDINPNLRVVAEYGHQETEWFDNADQNADIFSVGGFFFW